MTGTHLPTLTYDGFGLARRLLRTAGRHLLDLLYPPQCPGCHRAGALFCERCRSLVQAYPSTVCSRCGRPMPVRGLCSACAALHSPLEAVYPATVFASPIRQAIHALKYEGVAELAEPLSMWLAAAWQLHGLTADLIVPVPLHRTREAERGYNQSALLARELGRRIDVRVATTELVRAVHTRPQVGLNRDERRSNMAGVFRCAGKVTDLRIILIDDVCTTGATLEACAAALAAAGARQVQGLTLSRPNHEISSAFVPADNTALSP